MRSLAESGGHTWRVVEWAAMALLSVSLGAVLLVATQAAPEYALLIPAALFGSVGAYFALRHEVARVVVMIALSVLVLRPQEGFNVGDLVFVGYYGLFVLTWFLPRFRHYDEHLRRPEDIALALFLVMAAASLATTLLFGGKLSAAFSELVTLSVFSLYFPIRDVCARYRNGVIYMTGALLIVVGFASVRNLLQYQEVVLAAEHVWQFTRARVWVNDSLMMAGSVIAMVFTLFAHKRWLSSGFALLFGASFIALVMTQSRGFWVAFLLAVVFVFVFVGKREKVRLVVSGVAVAGLSSLVAVLFLSDVLPLIVSGLSERFGSLGTATSEDLSLVNRFQESRAVLGQILMNPVLGYGMGVPFHFHDITWDATMRGTFIHSGYLSLWYRFGLFGLVFILFFWGRSLWAGLSSFRMTSARMSLRAPGLAMSAVLFAYILPAQTSNPFVLIDSILLFTVLSAIAVGARTRAEFESENGSEGLT